jgi:GMP synthase (glutamine-hydrolysing)
MKKVLLVKNITREGPGLLEELLKEHNIASDLIDLDKKGKFPDPLEYDAVFVFGGPDSANDQTHKMKKEVSRIQEILTANIPYLGICLGLQVLVKAAGGKVVKNHTKEIGFRDPNNEHFAVTLTETVDLTEAGKRDPLFTNLGHTYHVFHLHGETVEPTKHMTLLAVGKFCWNQIVRVGTNAYGIQSHFELTPEMFERWIQEDPDLQKLDKDQLREDFASIKEEYTKVGKQLMTNFLKIAKLI